MKALSLWNYVFVPSAVVGANHGAMYSSFKWGYLQHLLRNDKFNDDLLKAQNMWNKIVIKKSTLNSSSARTFIVYLESFQIDFRSCVQFLEDYVFSPLKKEISTFFPNTNSVILNARKIANFNVWDYFQPDSKGDQSVSRFLKQISSLYDEFALYWYQISNLVTKLKMSTAMDII